MTILLIEDEAAAAQRLKDMVLQVEPLASILHIAESVAEAVLWLEDNLAPDLVISDVQLADGICFDIFKQVKITSPIIFTTAYDEYTLRAFKLNSIDYLLKPIDIKELQFAFSKYHTTKQSGFDTINEHIRSMMSQMSTPGHKSRFMVRQADRILTIKEENVNWLMADGNIVYLCTDTGALHIIDDPLDDLQNAMNPLAFFRLNRQYLARIDAIESIHNHFNGKLKIALKQCKDKEIFISREKAALFKKWLNR